MFLLLTWNLFSLIRPCIGTQSRKQADMLQQYLSKKNHSVGVLRGKDPRDARDEYTPEMRDKVMSDFRSGIVKVLITTNVLARGIDVAQVRIVLCDVLCCILCDVLCCGCDTLFLRLFNQHDHVCRCLL